MRGTILSVDFVHPDCGPDEMVIHVRVAQCEVSAGIIELSIGESGNDELVDFTEFFGGLSVRGRKALRRLGVDSYEQLKQLKIEQLLGTKDCGRTTISEIANRAKMCLSSDWGGKLLRLNSML